MDQKIVIVAVLALVVGGGLGIWFDRSFGEPETSEQATDTTQMTDVAATLKAKSGDDLDQAFLEEMIIHHEAAVEMSKQVVERSGRQELKDFSQGIIDAQSAEIKKMGGWLDLWFGAKG